MSYFQLYIVNKTETQVNVSWLCQLWCVQFFLQVGEDFIQIWDLP